MLFIFELDLLHYVNWWWLEGQKILSLFKVPGVKLHRIVSRTLWKGKWRGKLISVFVRRPRKIAENIDEEGLWKHLKSTYELLQSNVSFSSCIVSFKIQNMYKQIDKSNELSTLKVVTCILFKTSWSVPPLNCQNKGMDLIDEGYTCLLSERLELSNKYVSIYSLLSYSVKFFLLQLPLYNETYINLSTIQLWNRLCYLHQEITK